ncbi:hypothetical protein CU097_010876 [Rhizopus azygosporus]|uniref:BZIP domain-containing protein n=2 Tax=Rhizopus TaxID=4842 RepID=A0A367JCX1_RHIAZ|nr:hypothetical protein BCV71DRAFT_219308 [Rhizopus microsporus]RCH87788.1 hypothetical protein CU097_010876 [Rhizopus azygosporus]CEJ04574.1 Putative Podospora anserina S mat genomic DNA chromosome 7, supercontig 1 [Rhizopus microsporus]
MNSPPTQLLPPISMFTTGLASPPTTAFDPKKAMPILPKPYEDHLFPYPAELKRRSDPAQDNQKRVMTSEEVLAEKRRRNAGASARFRDRRKQRERELQERCQNLEKRTQELEDALRLVCPDHPLLTNANLSSPSETSSSTSSPSTPSASVDILGRINQLEQFITRFRVEKQTDAKKLEELENENKFLKSVLTTLTSKNDSQEQSAPNSPLSNV